MITGNAIVGQSGGPTSVINASLAGVIQAAATAKNLKKLYGMNYGIEGFMHERLVDLSALTKEIVSGLRSTPSSALGSSRYKLKDEDFPRIMEVLKKRNIHFFFLIGGNDTMDTISRVEKYCLKNGYELCAIGIPKTVDNDLFGTDHTPGYASAARANILSVMQAGLLAHDMQRVDKFVVYQTIGRDAGWLAAATSLARKQECDPPHLVYMPERAFHCDEFLSDAKACVEQYGFLSVVCGEGIKYSDGTPVSSSNVKDKFNNTEFGATASTSVAFNLHAMLRKAYGWRGEFQIPESLIMCAADRAVALDINEAIACGRRAVKLADKGESGQMVAMKRVPGDPYAVEYTTVPLSEVAVHTRPMPSEYVNERGNFVSSKFKRYIEPLVGKLPEYVKLKMKMAMMK